LSSEDSIAITCQASATVHKVEEEWGNPETPGKDLDRQWRH